MIKIQPHGLSGKRLNNFSVVYNSVAKARKALLRSNDYAQQFWLRSRLKQITEGEWLLQVSTKTVEDAVLVRLSV